MVIFERLGVLKMQIPGFEQAPRYARSHLVGDGFEALRQLCDSVAAQRTNKRQRFQQQIQLDARRQCFQLA